MQVFDWPSNYLSPYRWDLWLHTPTRSAGRSISGFEQVISAVSPRWRLDLEFNTLRKEAILPYRSMLAKLAGRENAIKVPIRDTWLWPTAQQLKLIDSIERDSPWPDYSSGETIQDVPVSASGSKGDADITVNFSILEEPELLLFEGMYFGLDDDLHIITGISWSGSLATISMKPTLQQDHSGAAFKLRPTLTCRLMEDESGRHPMERSIITAPSIELVQVLPDELL